MAQMMSELLDNIKKRFQSATWESSYPTSLPTPPWDFHENSAFCWYEKNLERKGLKEMVGKVYQYITFSTKKYKNF